MSIFKKVVGFVFVDIQTGISHLARSLNVFQSGLKTSQIEANIQGGVVLGLSTLFQEHISTTRLVADSAVEGYAATYHALEEVITSTPILNRLILSFLSMEARKWRQVPIDVSQKKPTSALKKIAVFDAKSYDRLQFDNLLHKLFP